jgi:hypothetical protein
MATRLRGKTILAFSTVSSLQPTQSLIEVVPVAVFSGCEADHSPPPTSRLNMRGATLPLRHTPCSLGGS